MTESRLVRSDGDSHGDLEVVRTRDERANLPRDTRGVRRVNPLRLDAERIGTGEQSLLQVVNRIRQRLPRHHRRNLDPGKRAVDHLGFDERRNDAPLGVMRVHGHEDARHSGDDGGAVGVGQRELIAGPHAEERRRGKREPDLGGAVLKVGAGDLLALPRRATRRPGHAPLIVPIHVREPKGHGVEVDHPGLQIPAHDRRDGGSEHVGEAVCQLEGNVFRLGVRIVAQGPGHLECLRQRDGDKDVGPRRGVADGGSDLVARGLCGEARHRSCHEGDESHHHDADAERA